MTRRLSRFSSPPPGAERVRWGPWSHAVAARFSAGRTRCSTKGGDACSDGDFPHLSLSTPKGGAGKWLAATGFCLVALVAFGLVVLGWQALPLGRDIRVHIFLASECIAGLLWWRAVVLVRGGGPSRRALWIVLAAAVMMRVLTLAAPPLLSSDM